MVSCLYPLFSFSYLQKKTDLLSREKEDIGKENQQLSRQLDEIKQQGIHYFFVPFHYLLVECILNIEWCILGKKSTSDTSGEQAMNQEKDTRIQVSGLDCFPVLRAKVDK